MAALKKYIDLIARCPRIPVAFVVHTGNPEDCPNDVLRTIAARKALSLSETVQARAFKAHRERARALVLGDFIATHEASCCGRGMPERRRHSEARSGTCDTNATAGKEEVYSGRVDEGRYYGDKAAAQ